MPFDTTTTRPAGTGGIDITGVDVATAVFTATGGGYGGGQTSPTTTGGEPVKTPDMVTNWGNGISTPADEFDFNTLPKDRDADIKLVAEPEGSHPLLDLIAGDAEPHFANGGPEGIGKEPGLKEYVPPGDNKTNEPADKSVGEIVLEFFDKLLNPEPEKQTGPSAERDPKTGLKIWVNQLTDPDQTTGDLQSPADMLAGLLGKAGVAGIDPSSPEITDILGKLSDNMGKVADLMGSLQDAAKAGDTGGVLDALDALMAMAGLDGADFNPADMPQDVLENMLGTFGIIGGLEGADWLQTLHDDGTGTQTVATINLSDWVQYITYDLG